jgi:hypothetical protein
MLLGRDQRDRNRVREILRDEGSFADSLQAQDAKSMVVSA